MLSTDDTIQMITALWAIGSYEVVDVVHMMIEIGHNGTKNQILTCAFYDQILQSDDFEREFSYPMIEKYKDDPEFAQEIDFRTSYVQFNLTDDVMSNVNMRKAISLAMNRSALTDNILADGSAPGFGLVADGMSGDGEKTFRELNGDVSPYDPEQAKEYYDKAVEELGSAPSEVTLLVADDSVSKSVATFIQSELVTTLGLNVVIDTKTVQGRGELMDANNYQFAVTAWGADYDDAMTYLDLWTNGTPYRGNYNDDDYNALISDAKAQTDDAVRLDDMLKAEKKLVEEDAVVAPVYHRGSAVLTKSNVKNLISHPIGVPLEFKYASFE